MTPQELTAQAIKANKEYPDCVSDLESGNGEWVMRVTWEASGAGYRCIQVNSGPVFVTPTGPIEPWSGAIKESYCTRPGYAWNDPDKFVKWLAGQSWPGYALPVQVINKSR